MFWKKSPAPVATADAIVAFWVWWQSARAEVAAALSAGDDGRYGQALSSAVQRMHPGLEWEVGRAGDGYRLVVTAAGAPESRSTAARWLLAAPREDSAWSYFAARQPDPVVGSGATLDIAGQRVGLSEVTVSLREWEDGPRVEATVHHRVFAALAAEERTAVAHLLLVLALGEEDTERWIGGLTASPEPAVEGLTLAELPAAVAELDERHPHAHALVNGVRPDGRPVMGIVQTRLSPVDRPLFDQHIAIAVPYRATTPAGLNPGPAGERLRAFEDTLLELVGDEAEVPAVISADGVRTFHCYADATGGVAERIRGWRHGWPDGRVRIDVRLDPQWQAVSAYRP
ncbi:DUF695 domain-containing protein [Kitasatospora nipponensis]